MSELTPQAIHDTLVNRFQEKILEMEMPYDFLTITVAHDAIKEVISFLYNDTSMSFKFLITCCGMHFPDQSKKFAMVYHLQNLETNSKIRLKTFTNDDPPHFPTLTDLFKGAGWMEREAFDFFGFRFDGHHNIRRILNMDNLEGWPLRKEFPLEDPFRKDKDDAMFGR
jgi:NADH-quinone oxidoreductase subunit C